MITSIRAELKAYLTDLIKDGVLNDNDVDDWHFYAFNEGYYILGNIVAKRWLATHGIDAFDAIAVIAEYDNDNFNELITDVTSPENVVNKLVYIYGENLFSEYGADDVEELRKALETDGK